MNILEMKLLYFIINKLFQDIRKNKIKITKLLGFAGSIPLGHNAEVGQAVDAAHELGIIPYK